MQCAKEMQTRRDYENLLKATTIDAEFKQFSSLRSQVDKMMAKMDVDEKELEEAKAAAKSYAAQLATATAQLNAFKKDSGDHVKKLTEQLNTLHVEVARNDKTRNEAIVAGEEYAPQLAKANHEFKDKCDEVDILQRKLEDLNNVEDGVGNEDASPPASPSVLHPIDLRSFAANVAYALQCKEVKLLQAELSAARAAIDATELITPPRTTTRRG
jgi:chromosome segregation ATPase